ncbi:hypothetical protein BDQ12DRAFT_656689 [Crucibulum laeve]|uniref:Arrestin-like N-terminal domain-containing protein n=1 Tax=Crucibulum laeve TaxID=68775 RepID=A0A5C3LMZ0_9AGAR|nr:hypothetical protein BDQ12DRAFT_656689 [Crucibulum laeve]
MVLQAFPEPMNASPHHPKVKVTLLLADQTFVAGAHVSGKVEMECRADKGLGIGVMMVELFAIQELTSRDHAASTTFLHSRRLFQGPGLPPSNAVQAHPMPGDPQLPDGYYQARRGRSSFLFRIPVPSSSPASINFGSGQARVRYELRASVGVFWKGEKRLVVSKQPVEVVEAYQQDFERPEPEAVVVGENGKFWMQGKVVGGLVVAGESACIELQVKNHSSKKNTGLTLSLLRTLVLSKKSPAEKQPLQISDMLTTVPFRGPEYIIPPGAEGVASLVFDVPSHACGVRGGTYDGDESEARTSHALFEIKCIVEVKMSMGLTSKDIILDIPVTIAHPAALPALPEPDPYMSPPAAYPYPGMASPSAPYVNPYAYPPMMSPPMVSSPPIMPYVDQNHVWLPPPVTHTPQSYQYFPPMHDQQPYYATPPPVVPVYIPRPSSAGPSSHVEALVSGLPGNAAPQSLLPLEMSPQQPVEAVEGKGDRALRVSHHLRISSRYRSVSPQSHRFPMPNPLPIPNPLDSSPQSAMPAVRRTLPIPPPLAMENLSMSPSASQRDGVVHSPRPQLTPRHSFSVDPVTKHALPKSERVEELEKMAAEVVKLTKDLSADLPKPSPDVKPVDNPDVNKTLPSAPTTNSNGLLSLGAAERKRVDTYFDAPPSDGPSIPEPVPVPIPSEKTPPTPTLLPRHARADFLSPGNESGLDALERRLLAEVGTRKLDLVDKRRDVRSVLPIAIPQKSPEPLNDSAISSLTLADHEAEAERERERAARGREQDLDFDMEPEQDHDSDVKTHRAGKSSISGDDIDGLPHLRERGREKEKKSIRKKGRDGDKVRKNAKGRVAAWLGGIDPDIPPPEDVIPPSPSVVRAPDTTPGLHAFLDASRKEEPEDLVEEPTMAELIQADDKASEGASAAAPNPRSSGFMPIGTLNRDTFQRRPLARDMTVVEEAKKVAELWSSAAPDREKPSPRFALISTPASTPQSIRTDRRVSPPSSKPEKLDPITSHARNAWKLPNPSVKAAPSPNTKKLLQPSVHLPSFPPPRQDPEVKYDIRSARGGRGGKVAAVASIWASAASGEPRPNGPQKKSGESLVVKPVRVAGRFPSPTVMTSATAAKPVPWTAFTGESALKDRQVRATEVTEISSPPKNLKLATDNAPTALESPSVGKLTPATDTKPKDLRTYASAAAGSTPTKPARPVGKPPSSPTPTAAVAADPKYIELAGKRSKPIIKSTSVPAVISSSHATPMLSSTASLARPQPVTPRVDRPPRLPGGLSTPKQEAGATHSISTPLSPPKSTTGDLAFGQARLRDLIKKYQGQGT